MLVLIMPGLIMLVVTGRVFVRPEQRNYLTLQAAVHGAGAPLLTGRAYGVDRDVRGEIQVRTGNGLDRPALPVRGERPVHGSGDAEMAVVDHQRAAAAADHHLEQRAPGPVTVEPDLRPTAARPPSISPFQLGALEPRPDLFGTGFVDHDLAPPVGLPGHDRARQVVQPLSADDHDRPVRTQDCVGLPTGPARIPDVPQVLGPVDPVRQLRQSGSKIDSAQSKIAKPTVGTTIGQLAQQPPVARPDVNHPGDLRTSGDQPADQLSDHPSTGDRRPEVLVGTVVPPETLRAVGVFDPGVKPGSKVGEHGPMVPDDASQPNSAAPPMPRLPQLPVLPQRLAAETPGWVREVDVVVLGSGIAGLTAALECSDLGTVMVVTKDVVAAGSTNWAQGGIASVQAEGDTVEQHVDDTLTAGAGLCIERAVRVLISEGPEEVAKLIARGAEFDRDAGGALELTREGGHHRNRIAHAGGDATGAEIERALISSVTADPGIEIIEHALVLDLIPAEVGADEPPAVAGVTLHVLGEGTRGGVGAVHARAVILATGGIGQIYAVTTNPPVSTGDGVAAALRAGARLRDIEFIQFHPTVLFLGAGARGQLPLVSEAVRGEGGLLVNSSGERFMVGQHELAELAPRDVVAKGIMKEMAKEGSDHVWVDGRMLGEETWRIRFPTILHSCRRAGIDPATDLIPVAPACHYFCGGVRPI